MNKKNIWILNHYVNPGGIGVGTRHIKFCENLIKKGHNVEIFAASTLHTTDKNMITESNKSLKDKTVSENITFIKARNYKGNGKLRILNMIDYFINVQLVCTKIKTNKPDVIYASSAHPLTWLAGYRLSKIYNAQFIAETRDLWPETLVAMGKIKRNSIPAKALYKLEKFIYKKADKLIFTFPGGKDYVESIGIDTSKVRYINNGIDIEEFNRNKIEYEFKDIDLENKDTFKVIYTGSMGQANELSYLMKSAKEIQESEIRNIKFILFGDGYERKELEEYAKENKLENVIFKGKVEKKYIASILSKSNLNIFTGKCIYLYKYGLSLNKMFDYFASGKPTLSNIECGYDIIQNYNSGITVKGGSSETLSEGILKFYNMPKEEYDMYCKNSLKAAKDFDFKVLTDKLEKVILEK